MSSREIQNGRYKLWSGIFEKFGTALIIGAVALWWNEKWEDSVWWWLVGAVFAYVAAHALLEGLRD